MITQKLVLTFGENNGLSFQDNEIPPAFLVSRGPRTLHTMFLFTLVARQTWKMGLRTLLTDILAFSLLIFPDSQLIFVYLDFIEYQHVGNSRAPILKIIQSERRLRDGSLNKVAPVHHKIFTIFTNFLFTNCQTLSRVSEEKCRLKDLCSFPATCLQLNNLRFRKY